eukprot:gene15365-18226_t
MSSMLIVEAATYINFEPFSKGGCTGANLGTGYSWVVGQCVGFRGNGYFLKYDQQSSEVTMLTYYNNNCTADNPTSKTFTIGSNSCYSINWADYGWYYNAYDYVVPSVVNNPGWVPQNGYRQTLYQGNDQQCAADYLMYFYYINGTQFSNTLQTFEFWCDNGIPMEKVCTGSSGCITTSKFIGCQSTTDGWEHNNLGVTC